MMLFVSFRFAIPTVFNYFSIKPVQILKERGVSWPLALP